MANDKLLYNKRGIPGRYLPFMFTIIPECGIFII